MTAVLTATGIGLSIGKTTLLDHIDLTLKSGEMVAIVGPNGAGKSTLLRTLSSDLRASRGTVALMGRDIHAWSPAELALRRAMLSQHVTVSFPFTVEEVVCMGRGSAALASVQTIVESAIDEVGLRDLRHRELPTLSGGEQQRAHFARILVQLACGEAAHGPGLLMLDEPTSSLDLRHQIALVEISRRRARQGTAVIAVLHDLNLAVRFADRIVVMRKGAVIADGTPVETITPDIIRRVFDIEVAVAKTEDGAPYLLPQGMQQIHS
ncbi:heme ABC transporter ATP-binding protein [Tardiphaga alba]|uniref:Heme ABC transporter ATP-binding protein n=1 Tax=Tardiphaga alba TaxID=340268 RepID=A0ABX8AEF6_9BRAD|nr:heme ABC transporter ATP-binding protein [Tardiphaga alba]QUS41336.1 heme ABC transporter ATP-binding protein [Tardiphaga alba]